VFKQKAGGAMQIPNYNAIGIVVLIVLAIALKVYAASPTSPAPQVWSPGCTASVPKSWGAFREASTQSGFAFEDSAGTLRFVTNVPCDGTPVVALEIRRTPGNATNGGNQ
jgi:hypothetical protein